MPIAHVASWGSEWRRELERSGPTRGCGLIVAWLDWGVQHRQGWPGTGTLPGDAFIVDASPWPARVHCSRLSSCSLSSSHGPAPPPRSRRRWSSSATCTLRGPTGRTSCTCRRPPSIAPRLAGARLSRRRRTARGIARHTGFTGSPSARASSWSIRTGSAGDGTTAAASRPHDDVGFVRALLDTLGKQPSRSTRGGSTPPASPTAPCSPTGSPAICPGSSRPSRRSPARCPMTLVPACASRRAGVAARLSGHRRSAHSLRRRRGGAAARGRVLSAARSAGLWATIGGCAGTPAAEPEPDRAPSDGMRVRRTAVCRLPGRPRAWSSTPSKAAARHLARRAAGPARGRPGKPATSTRRRRSGRSSRDTPSRDRARDAGGLTMDYPLTVAAIARRAESLWARRPVVSRRTDGTLHRTTYGECLSRAGPRLAAALQRPRRPPRRPRRHALLEPPPPFRGLLRRAAAWARCCTPSTCGSIPTSWPTSPRTPRTASSSWTLAAAAARALPRRTAVEHVIVASAAGERCRAGTLDYETLLARSRRRLPPARSPTSAPPPRCATPRGRPAARRRWCTRTARWCSTPWPPPWPAASRSSEHDVVLAAVPMFHANAWGLPYTAAMTGAALVFPGERPDARTLLDLCQSERVTFSAGVPTVWLGVLDALDASPGGWTSPRFRSSYRRRRGARGADRGLEERHGLQPSPRGE